MQQQTLWVLATVSFINHYIILLTTVSSINPYIILYHVVSCLCCLFIYSRFIYSLLIWITIVYYVLPCICVLQLLIEDWFLYCILISFYSVLFIDIGFMALRDVPIHDCPCGVGPCLVKMSRIKKNLGRLFWCCPNGKKVINDMLYILCSKLMICNLFSINQY